MSLSTPWAATRSYLITEHNTEHLEHKEPLVGGTVGFSSWSLLERCDTASPSNRNISVCHVVYARPSETCRKIHSLGTDTHTSYQGLKEPFQTEKN